MSVKVKVIAADPEVAPSMLRDAWEQQLAILPLAADASASELARSVTGVAIGTPSGQIINLDLPDDTALVVATSGSTGIPKGITLSHAALRWSTRASVERLGAQPGERFTLALPLNHVAGIQVVLRSWACGTEPEILPSGAIDALMTATGDHVSLVPTQLSRLLREPAANVNRWRSILVGGAALDDKLAAQARAADAAVVTSYGMTETAGGCVYDGVPLAGVDVTIVDGRISINGPMLFSGVVANGHYTAREPGPFVTADLGNIAADGQLRIVGRADDIVISGGENVPCARVASRLRDHPEVAQAAVFGVDDRDWGQRVAAIIVPSDHRRPPSGDELVAWSRETLPPTWAPRQYVVAAAIPLTGLGKPDVVAMRRLAEGHRPA